MTTDRSIRLDVSVPQSGTGQGGMDASRQQAHPDPDQSERFSRAMAGPTSDTDQKVEGPATNLPPPMSLFGRPGPMVRATDRPVASDFADRVGEALHRLMVGEGRSGGQQVRMDLKDDLLPGVTISIEEVQGRLQVDFYCRNDTSFERLVAAAPAEAPELAQRLRREVLLRVQSDDLDDPKLFEVGAAP